MKTKKSTMKAHNPTVTLTKKLKDNEFKCDDCGGIFDKEWSEEEALKEKEENGWGDMDMSKMAQVCDDCYNKIMNSMN